MKRVAVYWNLHKDVYSIQSRETADYGKVIGHAESVAIALPKFVVRQAGRQQVLKEQKKNVHAFVVGYLTENLVFNEEGKRITYNPYKYNSFVIADTKEEIQDGAAARLSIHEGKPLMEAW